MEIIKVEDYKNEKHNYILKKVSKSTLGIEFDKLFDYTSLTKDINMFILKP